MTCCTSAHFYTPPPSLIPAAVGATASSLCQHACMGSWRSAAGDRSRAGLRWRGGGLGRKDVSTCIQRLQQSGMRKEQEAEEEEEDRESA